MAKTYQIQSVQGSNSSVYFWKITNLNTGDINLFPVQQTELSLKNSTKTDYSFCWNLNGLNQQEVNIIDIQYIGSSGTPAYNNSVTDLASILALV